MAITAFNRHWVGTAARKEMNGPRTLRMRYRVECDSIDTETDLQILEDGRCPAEGDQITLRGVTYYVSSVEVEPPDDTNRILWHVTAELTDTPNGSGGDLDQPPNSNNPNPADDPPYWDFDSGDGVKSTNRDVDGNLIVNTAGDPPEPIQVFEPRPVINFYRNEMSFIWANARQYVGKANSSSWNGANAKTVLCRRIRAQQRWRNGVLYYAVVYSFEFRDRDEGWQHLLTSLGLREKVSTTDANGATTTELVPIYLDNGEPTQEPMPLDSNGKNCPVGYEAETEWKIYDTVDFGPLNIILPG